MIDLVTGGAGFIGSHLVERLLAAGHPVRVLEHPQARVDHLPLDRIELVRGDIRDAEAVREATRGCRHVYHLAADPNLWRRDRAGFDAINHRGAVQVMRTALDQGATRVLFTSTESILTSPTRHGGAVERARFHEGDMLGPYCLSKFHGERAALQLAEQGAPVLVCSPTLPVGPGDHRQTPPTRMALAFARGAMPAYLDCRFNLIDARDAAEGLHRTMQVGRPGIRYLIGAHNVRLIDWLTLLGEVLGRTPPRLQVPYALALAVGWCSERWADLVTHRQPLATVTGVRLTRRSMHFDPSASLAELSLTPRPLRTSALDAVAWYRHRGWLAPSTGVACDSVPAP
jgi:dihydroflavonol-4-reductase